MLFDLYIFYANQFLKAGSTALSQAYTVRLDRLWLINTALAIFFFFCLFLSFLDINSDLLKLRHLPSQGNKRTLCALGLTY